MQCNKWKATFIFSIFFSLFPALLLLLTRYSLFHLYSHALSSLSSIFSPSKKPILCEILLQNVLAHKNNSGELATSLWISFQGAMFV